MEQYPQVTGNTLKLNIRMIGTAPLLLNVDAYNKLPSNAITQERVQQVKINIEMTGTAPLLQHNIRLADSLDPIARSMKAVSGKRKKTDDDHEELARLEFAGGLYINELGPFVPGENIEKSFIEGGRITKQGKNVERALLITDNEVPLLYKGPRTVEDLWEDPSFRDRSAVKVGQARVMRTRPKFREWSLSAEAELDTTVLNLSELQEIATSAGRMVGICDYRPRFGRYEVDIKASA